MKILMLGLMIVIAASLGGCENEDVQKEIPGPSTLPDQPDSD
jgi:hypothetical protein